MYFLPNIYIDGVLYNRNIIIYTDAVGLAYHKGFFVA